VSTTAQPEYPAQRNAVVDEGAFMADANITEESAEMLAARLPVRRVGRPEDIANACAFLCSEASSYVTGQLIGVNGGRVVS